MNPRVSTIIPAHNASATLRDAVRSVLAEKIDDHEVIIVDDGSTDSTPDLAEELALGDERVWVIHQRRAGVSAARNAGLRVARGRWVHFLDADDWVLPGGLSELLRAGGEPGEDAGTLLGVCAGAALFDFSGRPLGWSIGPSVAAHATDVGVCELLQENRFQAASCLIPAAALKSARFDESLSASEDWDLWLRLAERGLRWRIVNKDVSAYRQSRAGLSRAWGSMASQTRWVLERAYARCRENHAALVPMSELRREHELDVIVRHAVGNATGAALEDHDRDVDEAFTVLVLGLPGVKVTPEAMAWGAFWKLPHADGLSPAVWHSPEAARLERYAAALDRLWTRMVRESACDAGAPSEARAALAGLLVDPEGAAGRLADACRSARAVTLLGAGRNAGKVAAAMHARGIRFDARDDAASGESFGVLGGVEVEIHGPGAPMNPDARYVMTAANDAAYLASLPKGLDVVRWNDAVSDLRATELNRLLSAWPGQSRLGAAA